MSSPAWPFSWPSPDTWGTELDEAAAIIAASPRRAARLERIKAYEVEAPGIRCETTRLGEAWYATAVYTGPDRHLLGVVSLGVFPDHYAALDAIHLLIDAHEAAET